MDKIDGSRLPENPLRGDYASLRRSLTAGEGKCVVVGGVTLQPQGFSRPADQVDLQVQCSELNRQAVMPAPESLAGKSFRQILESRER